MDFTTKSVVDAAGQHARNIFNTAVLGVLPHTMVSAILKCQADYITVRDKRYASKGKNVQLVGFGKAVIGMATSVQNKLGEKLHRGIIVVPHGTLTSLINAGRADLIPDKDVGIQIHEGARNNLPDTEAFTATKKIIQLVKSLTENDILFVLVSGGGSALLTAPLFPVTLQEKKQLTALLAESGVTITELNTVRTQVSCVKGGKLGQMAYPAQVITLILSDVIGDPLEQIASGPTTLSDNKASAWSIIQKYHLEDKIPSAAATILKNSLSSEETGNEMKHVDNYLIGNNELALRAARDKAQTMGYATYILSNSVCGTARSFGQCMARISHLLVGSKLERNITDSFKKLETQLAQHNINPIDVEHLLDMAKGHDRLAVLSGGETVVHVLGNGIGGRNQEASLSCSLTLEALFDANEELGCSVEFLSAGTDGIDGPTEAAGAIAYMGQARRARRYGIVPENYLNNNDSNGFFKKHNSEDLITTGVTGTNVMDIHVLLLCFKH